MATIAEQAAVVIQDLENTINNLSGNDAEKRDADETFGSMLRKERANCQREYAQAIGSLPSRGWGHSNDHGLDSEPDRAFYSQLISKEPLFVPLPQNLFDSFLQKTKKMEPGMEVYTISIKAIPRPYENKNFKVPVVGELIIYYKPEPLNVSEDLSFVAKLFNKTKKNRWYIPVSYRELYVVKNCFAVSDRHGVDYPNDLVEFKGAGRYVQVAKADGNVVNNLLAKSRYITQKVVAEYTRNHP